MKAAARKRQLTGRCATYSGPRLLAFAPFDSGEANANRGPFCVVVAHRAMCVVAQA